MQIGKSDIVKDLSDLGSASNLFPFICLASWFGKARPSFVVLQIEDKTRVLPKIIIEDVLINFGKFIIPANIIVLNYDADKKLPIILGHPFLSTDGALLDVWEGTF